MQLKRLQIKQITDSEYDEMPDRVNISEPFITVLVKCESMIGDKRFIKFLKNELGCSYKEAINPILDKTEYMVLDKHYHLKSSIHKVIDTENGEITGYAIPPFKELEIALRNWKKLIIKINNMKEGQENILPVSFEQANVTLKGGDKADDLPAFNDGKTTVSCWRPTFWAVVKIMFTRKIWLGVLNGNTQPPVWLTADKPFKE